MQDLAQPEAEQLQMHELLDIEVTYSEAIRDHYLPTNRCTLFSGPCKDLLGEIPAKSVQLFITSPPYNIGKRYERKMSLEAYLHEQAEVIALCAERLTDSGSICWQVGNHIVDGGEIIPLDIVLYPLFRRAGLVLRNRIVWHFEHGLHCKRRFSGRYETVLWFTRPGNQYLFDVNPIRVPQKYPGKKYYKGPKAGEYSANPLGKNPGDVWVIPNVKHNHVEKTEHPCQFPVELVERFVLSLTAPGDLVLDPFAGVGSTAVGALKHGRRAAGSEIVKRYVDLAKKRVQNTLNGTIKTRPMSRPVHTPSGGVASRPLIVANKA